MEKKQLYQNKKGEYNKFFPLVDLNTVLDSSDDKTLNWIILGYNHLYVEWRENAAVTRDEIPLILRHNGLHITYNNGSGVITEFYTGSNSDISNYAIFTSDDSWEKVPSIEFLEKNAVIPEKSILPEHLSDTLQQLIADSDITIHNFPDEEDITQNGMYLKFRDRLFQDDNVNGLGYKILRKNLTVINSEVVNVLTQDMISSDNTIYEIRYDYVLKEDIIIPENCVLYFNGGCISNGGINFNNCKIVSNHKCFSNLSSISGIQTIKVEWFGIEPQSQDISNAFNSLVNSITNTDQPAFVFQKAKYNTASTLVVNKSKISILGYPTFYCSTPDITCIRIEGSSIQTFEFNVSSSSPSIWANNNSIGVLLINCTCCNFRIQRIYCFTYGLVCRGDNAGFAWNNLYINRIDSALQGIVIESKNTGWPNANNIYGTAFMRHSGTYNMNGAQEPCRDVVFKNDNTYGANSWVFDGLWFENRNAFEINGEPYYPLDISDYMNSQIVNGIRIVNCRFEIYNVIAFIKSKKPSTIPGGRNNNIVYQNNTSLGGVSTVIVDTDGNKAPATFFTNSQNYKYLANIINYDNDELVGSYRLSKDSRYFGYGTYGKFSRRFGVFGYLDKCVCMTNFEGVNFQIAINGRIHIYFLDNTLQPVNTSTIEWQGWNSTCLFQTKSASGITYIDTTNDINTTLQFRVNNAGTAKYIVFGANPTSRIELRYSNASENLPIFYNPLGHGGANTYVFGAAITALRSTFEVGDIYYDSKNEILYQITSSGSIGTNTIVANGNSGDSFITVNAITDLYVGDYIEFNNTKYKITSIDASNLTIYLNKLLDSDLINVNITFSNPSYVQIA